ncbi:MAG: pcp 3 [Phycisphaerales bacterium]|nr:pcp 3 [Phycisphaerales bacterium]
MGNTQRVVTVEGLEPRRLLSSNSVQLEPVGLTPQQVRQAYGFDQVTFSSKGKAIAGNGKGQTIAIVNPFHAPTIAKDLRTFDKTFGITNRDGKGDFALSVVTPQGKPKVDAGWAQETSLDVEWAHAIAPAAHILLIEAKSDSQADLFKAVDYARKRRGVTVVSMSWGWDMTSAPPASLYGPAIVTPPNHVGGFKKGDGVTFVEAGGDNGLATAWPDASVPIVSVGGTTLSLDAGGNYAGETLLPQSAGTATVAYNADPNPGFAMYDSTPFQGTQGWQGGTGTSAGAPQWAGLFAIANQGRALAHKHSLDGPTQTLPALASFPAADFHPITNGGPSTGRGSPFADRVIGDLVAF